MNKITIIGLGYSDINGLSVEGYRTLFEEDNSARKIICRTETHSAVQYMLQKGIKLETLDRFYENAESFDLMYDSMYEYICAQAESNDVILCVSGSPAVGDILVQKITENYSGKIKTVPCEGAAEYISSVSGMTLCEGVNIIPAHLFRKDTVNTRVSTLISEADNKFLVSEIKLKLLEMYPDDFEIFYFYGYPDTKFAKIPLFDMDRQKLYDFSVNFVILPLDNFEKKLYDIGALFEIMRILRGQNVEASVGSLKYNPCGCSWDKEQTHESIRQNIIEEAYEVVEAINNNDIDNLIEELGDMLLQVVFHSQIAAETGEFTFSDVVNGIVEKLIRRHPHVFGDTTANDSKQALDSWEQVKREEKNIKSTAASILSLPKDLPPFTKACKIIRKTQACGYNHEYSPKASEVMRLLESNADNDNIAEILFAVADVCRKMDINPDVELKKYTDAYARSFAESESIN